jgi:Uma2 family endonuclease
MNIHPTAPTDPDAFLRWNEGREGKRELVNGKVIEMMIHVTRDHARVVSALMITLAAAFDRTRYEVFSVDFGMKTPSGVRYPDLVVDVAAGSGKDLAVTAPVLVCEVLSPSSIGLDMVEKAADYTAVPTVQAYLVMSQDEPRAWLWLRDAKRWTGPTMIEEPNGMISVPGLGLAIPLAALYPQARSG